MRPFWPNPLTPHLRTSFTDGLLRFSNMFYLQNVVIYKEVCYVLTVTDYQSTTIEVIQQLLLLRILLVGS